MSSHAAFLQAIVSAPDDDTHRLVYADWLDDNGDPRRAEFIRLQCRLASLDECDPERSDLLDREWELLTVYRKRWQPGTAPVPGKYFGVDLFVRGFLGRVALPADVLLDYGEALFRDHPIQHLRVWFARGQLEEIVARPWMANVSSLDLSKEVLTLDELRALTASPHLGGLRQLTLSAETPEGLGLLAGWPGLRAITHLTLSHGHDRKGDWLGRLLESPHLGELASLAGVKVSDADVALLANSPRLAGLTRLSLESGDISAEGFHRLAAAKGLPALRHLSAGWGNASGVEGLPALVASPLLARLDTLDLSLSFGAGVSFGGRAAAALAASPHLGRLRKLNLTQCGVGPEEARAIAKARFGSLEDLRLTSDRIGPEGMAALAGSPHLASLRSLSVLGGHIGSKGLESLALSPTLAGLRYLDLRVNELDPEAAKVLAGSPHRARLRHLALGMNSIGARGARAILLAANLAGLWTLELSQSHMTDATARAVAAKTPLRELRRLIFDRLSDRGLTAEGERVLAASPNLPHLLVVDRTASFPEKTAEVSPVVLAVGKGQELK
jgi:uncharacterized protein (TIGR02996 family)